MYYRVNLTSNTLFTPKVDKITLTYNTYNSSLVFLLTNSGSEPITLKNISVIGRNGEYCLINSDSEVLHTGEIKKYNSTNCKSIDCNNVDYMVVDTDCRPYRLEVECS